MIATKMQRRLRASSLLVLIGLLIELASLLWSHPTAFLVFVILGILFMALGILLYLYSLVTISEAQDVAEG
jgi:uncharacterized membrane protein YczE